MRATDLYRLPDKALALLSGLLFILSWPAIGGMTPLVFIAWIPLLVIEDKRFKMRSERSARSIFWPVFLGFLLFNIGTTYFILYIREPSAGPVAEWVSRISAAGLTYVLNSSFMAIVFWLFHASRRRLGDVPGYVGLVMFWLAFEFIHYQWSINWPWLNLGNVFAERVKWVQWYEYTGVAGGTIWVLWVNIILFKWVKTRAEEGIIRKRSILWLIALILVPVSLSLKTYHGYEPKGEEVEIVLAQPNLDPYSEKFVIPPSQQLERMLQLLDSADTENTAFYVLPETAIQERAVVKGPKEQIEFMGMWSHQYNRTWSIQRIKEFLNDRNGAMVAGAADRSFYSEKSSPTARYIEPLDIYYDSFNSTLLITDEGVEQAYRKSKLVPGVESLPFVSVLSFLDELALDLGGATGSLGTQEERTVFEHGGMSLAPTICYESVFGEFNVEFVRNGAQALFISTNDSWWQDSPGYKQLLAYGRLRAIETRKGIARSANTGITCFIDQKGDITESLPWWTEGALRGTVRFNDYETFYSRHGDFMSRVATLFSLLLLLWGIVRPLKGKLRP